MGYLGVDIYKVRFSRFIYQDAIISSTITSFTNTRSMSNGTLYDGYTEVLNC